MYYLQVSISDIERIEGVDKDMDKLTVEALENYLRQTYKGRANEQSLFMKLVEEIGEVAEILNNRSGRKNGKEMSNDDLANELADVIHYTVALAAINDIDLTHYIVEKDKSAAIKYNHETNLKTFIADRY